MQIKAGGMECGMWNVECGVWSEGFGVWTKPCVECGGKMVVKP